MNLETHSSEERDQVGLQNLSASDIIGSLEQLMPIIFANDPLKDTYCGFISLIKSTDAELIKKLVQNSLTILDKQRIIDLIWHYPLFQSYIRASTKPELYDLLLESVPHDMKIKIENQPDSYLSESSGETYGLFDFFKILSQIAESDSIPSEKMDEIKQQFQAVSAEVQRKGRRFISDQFKITCLSERMDSPLMWSHYANKHQGFCLEYDFTSTITAKRFPDLLSAQLMLFPVIYTENRPLLSEALFGGKFNLQYLKTKKLPPDFLETIMYGLLFKSKDWEYEKEWRIFQILPNKSIMKLPKARKVFLGASMEATAKDRIVGIAKNKHIPVFQMFLHSDKYRFDYFQIE